MGRAALAPGEHGNIPTPRQVGPKLWEASCRYREYDGTTSRVIRNGTSRRGALRNLQVALDDKRGHTTVEKLRPHDRVAAAADVWIARIAGELAATSLETYRRLLDLHVRPGLGELRLRETGVAALQAFFDTLKDKGLSPSTRRTVKTVVLGVLDVAVHDEALPDNPARKLGRIRSGARKAARALAPGERADLLAKFDADPRARLADLPDLVRFMLGTGVRIGEALGARWADLATVDVPGTGTVPVVNITGNVVRVTGVGLVRHEGKTETARRVIPLPGFVVDMLTARRTGEVPDDLPLFPSTAATYRDASNTSRSLRAALARSGHGWVVFHTLRKTAASEWQRMGLDARVVADLMGHAQVSMTQDVYLGRRMLHPASSTAMDTAWLDGTPAVLPG